MKVSNRYLKAIVIGAVVIVVTLGYLTVSLYKELRVFFATKPPKVLASKTEDPQCRPTKHSEDNPNKFLFVSCSGFYDEE